MSNRINLETFTSPILPESSDDYPNKRAKKSPDNPFEDTSREVVQITLQNQTEAANKHTLNPHSISTAVFGRTESIEETAKRAMASPSSEEVLSSISSNQRSIASSPLDFSETSTSFGSPVPDSTDFLGSLQESLYLEHPLPDSLTCDPSILDIEEKEPTLSSTRNQPAPLTFDSLEEPVGLVRALSGSIIHDPSISNFSGLDAFEASFFPEADAVDSSANPFNEPITTQDSDASSSSSLSQDVSSSQPKSKRKEPSKTDIIPSDEPELAVEAIIEVISGNIIAGEVAKAHGFSSTTLYGYVKATRDYIKSPLDFENKNHLNLSIIKSAAAKLADPEQDLITSDASSSSSLSQDVSSSQLKSKRKEPSEKHLQPIKNPDITIKAITEVITENKIIAEVAKSYGFLHRTLGLYVKSTRDYIKSPSNKISKGNQSIIKKAAAKCKELNATNGQSELDDSMVNLFSGTARVYSGDDAVDSSANPFSEPKPTQESDASSSSSLSQDVSPTQPKSKRKEPSENVISPTDDPELAIEAIVKVISGNGVAGEVAEAYGFLRNTLYRYVKATRDYIKSPLDFENKSHVNQSIIEGAAAKLADPEQDLSTRDASSSSSLSQDFSSSQPKFKLKRPSEKHLKPLKNPDVMIKAIVEVMTTNKISDSVASVYGLAASTLRAYVISTRNYIQSPLDFENKHRVNLSIIEKAVEKCKELEAKNSKTNPSSSSSSQIYPNNFENWEFDKEAPQNFEVKPTPSKTNFQSCLGITQMPLESSSDSLVYDSSTSTLSEHDAFTSIFFSDSLISDSSTSTLSKYDAFTAIFFSEDDSVSSSSNHSFNGPILTQDGDASSSSSLSQNFSSSQPQFNPKEYLKPIENPNITINAIVEALAENKTIAEVARSYGFSKSTLEQYVRFSRDYIESPLDFVTNGNVNLLIVKTAVQKYQELKAKNSGSDSSSSSSSQLAIALESGDASRKRQKVNDLESISSFITPSFDLEEEEASLSDEDTLASPDLNLPFNGLRTIQESYVSSSSSLSQDFSSSQPKSKRKKSQKHLRPVKNQELTINAITEVITQNKSATKVAISYGFCPRTLEQYVKSTRKYMHSSSNKVTKGKLSIIEKAAAKCKELLADNSQSDSSSSSSPQSAIESAPESPEEMEASLSDKSTAPISAEEDSVSSSSKKIELTYDLVVENDVIKAINSRNPADQKYRLYQVIDKILKKPFRLGDTLSKSDQEELLKGNCMMNLIIKESSDSPKVDRRQSLTEEKIKEYNALELSDSD